MADEKISEMTAATVVNDADMIPIVQSGANKRATRPMLLTAESGEDIALTGNGSDMMLANSGGITFTFTAGEPVTFTDGSTDFFEIWADGSVHINAPDDQYIQIGPDTCAITLAPGTTSTNGSIVFKAGNDGGFFFHNGTDQFFQIGKGGNAGFNSLNGYSIEIEANGDYVYILGGGDIELLAQYGQSVIATYLSNSTYWNTTKPDYMHEALDRLASAVYALRGNSKIP